MPPVHPNLMAICNLCVNKKLLRGTSGDKKTESECLQHMCFDSQVQGPVPKWKSPR